MARWQLRNAHYLNVPGTEWEYEETNRDSGKRARTRFPVPMYLDPRDPADHTPPGSGSIVVCYEGKGFARDIIFVGEPTPDMEPLDEEAEAISKALEAKWSHPIDTLPATGDYSQSLLNKFQRDIDAIAKAVSQPNTVVVDKDEFEKLKEQVAALTAKAAPEAAARR